MFTNDEDLDISIDLTPMLDVLFILLLFFILTATFSKPFLEVALPKADSAIAEQQAEDNIFTITKEGAYFFNDKPLDKENLNEAFKNLKPGAIIFNVDEGAVFASFISLVDAARAAGREDFAIQTKA